MSVRNLLGFPTLRRFSLLCTSVTGNKWLVTSQAELRTELRSLIRRKSYFSIDMKRYFELAVQI